MISHTKRSELIHFLKTLRETMIAAFEEFETEARFVRQEWAYQHEGGGEIALLKGEFFEKAAVNWSGLSGPTFPMSDGEGAFFATGISLITHMVNPHLPTVHFNIRFIETETKSWFGGGYDLTPMGFPYQEDATHFHNVARQSLDQIHPELYTRFSQNAKTYFFIPHRKKERGIGGIFFDHLCSNDFEYDLRIWKTVGHSFLPAILPIYHKRKHQSYTLKEREQQLLARGHYVEFNLLYDRGTRFGFQSGGNPDAILCSLPPVVKW